MIENIQADIVAALNTATKRDLKILHNNFVNLDKNEVKNAKVLLGVNGISDVEQELILFYIKGKPTVRLNVDFDKFEKYRNYLKSIE